MDHHPPHKQQKLVVLVPGHNKVSIQGITPDLFDIAYLHLAANTTGGFDVTYELSRPDNPYDGAILERDNLTVQQPAAMAEIKFL